MQESILKIRSKYPNSIMIYQQSAIPNGIKQDLSMHWKTSLGMRHLILYTVYPRSPSLIQPPKLLEDYSYVNATKLCKDGGKEFKHWHENVASKRFIKALEEQLGHQASDSTPGESSLTGKMNPMEFRVLDLKH